MEFFGTPPAEIGLVSSAHSTLNPTHRSFGFVPVVLIRVGFCGTLASIAFGLTEKGLAVSPLVVGLCTVLWGLVGLCLGWYLTSFVHVCTYCGNNGIAELTLRGARENPYEMQMLLFADAAELRTKQTLNRTEHGIYAGTSYQFEWTDFDRKRLLKLKGSYYSYEGKPKAASPYWYAHAAERGWNAVFAKRMTAEFEQKGFVEFRVNREDQVRIGYRFLEFVIAGRTERLPRTEIRELRLKGGMFDVRTPEARWYHNKGRYSFRCNAVSNAQMFLAALDQLGYSVHGDRKAF